MTAPRLRFLLLLAVLGLGLLALVVAHSREAAEGTPVDIGQDPESIERLRSLGYVEWVDAGEETKHLAWVTFHDPARANAGYNLFASRQRRRAFLLDMKGRIVHEWHSAELDGTWNHIEMTPSGDLFVINEDGYLAKLTWSSDLVWKREMPVHHDLEVGESGEVYTLVRRRATVPRGPDRIEIVNDAIAIVSPGGELIREIPLYDMFADLVAPDRIRTLVAAARAGQRPPKKLMDLLHTNTIERIDRDIPGVANEGDFLLCMRHLDLVAIVDPVARRRRWSWGPGQIEAPHHPTFTRDGNILIFDNGSRRAFSRVIELEPRTGRIVWEYRGQPPEAFFSDTRGGNEKLPNGNVLITESDRGHVFEVTPAGQMVWQFYNPDMKEEDKLKRAAIYRMKRFEPSLMAPLIRGSAP